MSAGHSSQRFQVIRGNQIGYTVCDVTRVARDGFIVDLFRSHQAAERAAQLLNTGAARIDHHAVAGCRVIVP